VDILLRDFRYAIRRIAGNPGFAAITIAIMALGIGVNTAIFSIVDTVLFKPPPYRDVDRVVNIYTVGDDGFAATSSYPDILEFAGATDLFGVVIGLVLAAGSTFPLSRVLYGIDGLAPGTYLAVASVFFSIALLASFIRARRAAQVDPVVALRSE